MSENAILAITSDYTYKDECQQAALRRGYQLDYAKTMDDGLNKLLDKDYALVVIHADTTDYLPLLRVIKQIRLIPILVFTYMNPTDKAVALKMGADVYITPPFTLDYIIESSSARCLRLNIDAHCL